MGFLDKLLGRAPEPSGGFTVESAVNELSALYDDPEVKSERGLGLLGPRAKEVRVVGQRLHKAGGRTSMLAARDGLRQRHSWAVGNLEAIWTSLPEWAE